eukprot:CAMPEP_0195002068 /NCGR_PEP_ID=MMETSP0326_2-20130528/2160_1 /TAXON_ID=2866 ORGANISM="Crypthecodinium cohnii, Strain Seligo" /NCGR_SAMPLE_ID=MMETSP0326_2 /ASSEMBLY_ACC=CAM_ASM_000348 /LENGTH=37 /DNA_ID= /DNA_START= /DNA_END= /DNA_ORIENTATION=
MSRGSSNRLSPSGLRAIADTSTTGPGGGPVSSSSSAM